MKNPLHILLLQFLPIVVFIAVDAVVEDPVWAIGAALGFVLVQTVTTFARTKKFDPFILVDALLIGGMGAASLLTHDEVFFLLKPAIIEGIMVPYLAFLALAPDRVLSGLFDRYSLGRQIPIAAFGLMRRLIVWMAAFVLIHAGLVVIAALNWSHATWAWISGPGFYVLLVPLGIWIAVQRFRRRPAARSQGARIRKGPIGAEPTPGSPQHFD